MPGSCARNNWKSGAWWAGGGEGDTEWSPKDGREEKNVVIFCDEERDRLSKQPRFEDSRFKGPVSGKQIA